VSAGAVGRQAAADPGWAGWAVMVAGGGQAGNGTQRSRSNPGRNSPAQGQRVGRCEREGRSNAFYDGRVLSPPTALRHWSLRTPSPRPADQLTKRLGCPAPSASTLCQSSSTGSDGHPGRPGSGGVALLTGDRARHAIAATTGALGRGGRPGPRCQTGSDPGHARAPVPIVNRRSPWSASRDGSGTHSGGLPAKAVRSSPCPRAAPPSPRRPRRGTPRTPAPGSAPAGR
jgi:hypothetical protein